MAHFKKGLTGMNELNKAIDKMAQRIADILEFYSPSIYLYGSVVLDDFKLGWSDIDILVLTEKPIPQECAERLVNLRQIMLIEERGNPYYRSFEGGMLSLHSFLSGGSDKVVYWGTSGERITTRYKLDAFGMCGLLDNGIMLYGDDIRDLMTHPDVTALAAAVHHHYETIRRYARKTGRELYSYGWLLDISRCIYTLRTGQIIAKTAAGEWALQENICPCEDALRKAVAVRRNPIIYKNDLCTFDYAENLGDRVQKYADVLEQELKKYII